MADIILNDTDGQDIILTPSNPVDIDVEDSVSTDIDLINSGQGLPGAPGIGVPIGGLDGQVLAKASNTDYDTEWVNQSGGGGSVTSVNAQTGAVVLDTDDINDTATNRYTSDSDITRLASTSGTNTGDQDLSGYVPTTRTVNGKALSSNITLNQDDVGDGTTYKQYSQTEKTKLAGIASGATANTGTVTSVSVITANGVSGSVATSTTTPAISLALGAITPSSVNSVVLSGSATPTLAVTGTVSVSGTNTGDQTSVTGNAGTATALQNARTIGTLTGDVVTAGSSFNGTANNTNATVLATVNSNVGSFTKANVTVNAKGLVTAASSGTADFVTSLTTVGTSGAASVTAGVLNIPNYAGGGGSAGITRSITSISTNTSAGSTSLVDYVYIVSAGATLTLPTAVGNTNAYEVNNSGATNATVNTTSSQTINGNLSMLISPNSSRKFYSDNSNWRVF